MKSLILSLLLLTAASVAAAHEEASPEKVNVVGTGKIEAEPDQVTLSVTSYAIGEDLKRAKRTADERYQRLLDQIKKHGIDDKDVKVTQLSMYPEYKWTNQERVYLGERVSRSLLITVKDLEKLTPLLQSVVEKGVSEVAGMTAGFQDKTGLQRQALAAASADAHGKAKFLAKQFDRKLGRVINIMEQNSDVPMFSQRASMRSQNMAEADFAPPPEMLGTQTIEATLNVSFQLD